MRLRWTVKGAHRFILQATAAQRHTTSLRRCHVSFACEVTSRRSRPSKSSEAALYSHASLIRLHAALSHAATPQEVASDAPHSSKEDPPPQARDRSSPAATAAIDAAATLEPLSGTDGQR